MRQQINLYQPIFNATKKPLSASTVGIALAAVIVLLAGVSLYAARGNSALGQNVEMLRAQLQQQEQLLEQAGSLRGKTTRPQEVEERVRQLEAKLVAHQRALEILSTGAAGQTQGFATRLEALSRGHVEGLWVDGVILSGTNGGMSLSGGTLDPDIVPVYLRSLARDPVLAGTRFDDFIIERPDAQDEGETGDEKKHAKRIDREQLRFRAASKALLEPPVPEGQSS